MTNTLNKPKNEKLRHQAEELLRIEKAKPNHALSKMDTLALIHELEVHQIELELQNQELILAKDRAEIAEEKYSELYDFGPTAYITLSKVGTITNLNFCAARMLGKERSVLENKPFAFFVSEETRTDFRIFFKKVFKANGKESCELTLSINGLQPLNVAIHGILSKKADQCFLSIMDITDRIEAERNLVAKEKAEESDRLKTAFLHNLSHEIRSPMNAIMGFSEILAEQYNNKEKLELYSKIIHQRCSDLLDIINDVLDVAKIESGQLPVVMVECDLRDLFDELRVYFTELQCRLKKHDILFDLRTLCDPTLAVILTDKVKLKQIFINLITNAFKFTDKGKIEGGCKLDNNHNLVFYVSDTGIGIPLDKQEDIFNRFTQLNQSSVQNMKGTGLGLSIVKGLVNLLGGNISLDSKPGIGSTFSFAIPFKKLYQKSYQS